MLPVSCDCRCPAGLWLPTAAFQPLLVDTLRPPHTLLAWGGEQLAAGEAGFPTGKQNPKEAWGCLLASSQDPPRALPGHRVGALAWGWVSAGRRGASLAQTLLPCSAPHARAGGPHPGALIRWQTGPGVLPVCSCRWG